MGMSLSLFHQIDTLRADFHAVDERLGREWVRQALQGEKLVSQGPFQLVLGRLFDNETSFW